ncbi:uncharacterized protein [Nicotiana tomentosiformis]|uniref:uncharacterized protein n=1 Tax=Nicotiana tomentosiformis TaxID=4098 RepID=UPI00388C3D00
MYHDIRGIYWWDKMKKDIAEFVVQCPNYQHVKIEHQKLCGLLQAIEILTCKWEVINMDFIIGLPCIQQVLSLQLISGGPSKKDWGLRLLAAQSRRKSYADNRRRDLEFQVYDWVFLKVSSMKGVMRFGKKGKLSPRCIGDPSKVIPVDDVQVIEQLSYKEAPIAILDRQV